MECDLTPEGEILTNRGSGLVAANVKPLETRNPADLIQQMPSPADIEGRPAVVRVAISWKNPANLDASQTSLRRFR
jgi:hypothetical protein